uniref:Secreted protein n=1 Tax=Parastrongyloides trichosuri TaxID=131310 RepID=A0A0N5A2E0_PARTI
MSILSLYLYCFAVTSLLFAGVLLILYSVSRYVKSREKEQRKMALEMYKTPQSVKVQRMPTTENNYSGPEEARCSDSTVDSCPSDHNNTSSTNHGSYDKIAVCKREDESLNNDSNPIILSSKSEYYDLSCCSQEGKPCHKHQNPQNTCEDKN